MRTIYPADITKAGTGYPIHKRNNWKRRLNKKKFVVFIVVLLVLTAACILAWGAWHGTVAQAFGTVEKWVNTPTGTAKQTTDNTSATKTPGPVAAANASAVPGASQGGKIAPQPTPESQASNSALPAFLKSGQGEMKAFGIQGINPASDKVVALTFDDGPNPSTTDEILDALKQNGGHATFFVIGERAKQFPQTVKNIVADGNEIGNHTYDHTDLKTITAEQVKSEIQKTNDVLTNELGASPILVRPPNGSITQKIADEIGKACVLWTVDPEDWKYRNVDKDYNNVMDVARDGDIVLMHDIYKQSADAAVKIIRDLTKKGYKLVTVSQMIQIAESRGKNVGLIVSDLRTPKSTGTSSK
jgi:peptidoglycan-N-acetylglucosamine deacetylase